jgi:hypothetical protein
MIGTLCRELADHTLILNEKHLREVLHEYLAHNTTHPNRTLAQPGPHQTEATPPEPSTSPTSAYTTRLSSAA